MNSRLNKLKALLLEKNLDGALISSVPNIIYLTNFAHFSTHEREAFVIVTQNKNFIITDKRYSHAVRKNVEDLELLELSSEYTIPHLIGKVVTNEQIKKLGIESTNLTVHEWDKIKTLAEETKHFDLSPIRVIKDSKEIAFIQKACELGDQAFTHILTHIKEGMTEKEVAFELEHFIRKNGADISFSSIIAFEENAAIPHHKTGNRKLERGNLILLDFGVKYEEYCSDMTRTICFGKATEEKKKIHQTVLEAQEKAISFLNSQFHPKWRGLLLPISKGMRLPVQAALLAQYALSRFRHFQTIRCALRLLLEIENKDFRLVRPILLVHHTAA